MREVAHSLFKDEFRLTTQQKAERVLTRIALEREALAIIPSEHAEEFTSLVLHIDRAENQLIIDDLNPAHGNRRVAEGQPFFCLGRSDGVYVGFQSHLLKTTHWEGYGALCIAYPDTTYYLQRRSYYRVTVSAGDVNHVEVQRRGARSLKGQCHDISGSGMRILVEVPTDFSLTEGEYIPLVRFELDGIELASEAQIRSIGPLRSAKVRQPMRTVGVQFLNMTAAFERRVTNYVQRRDRELLRDAKR
ncbi:flagellar brake protein [Thiomonas sp. FB-Cd]|uniref:flagellar brake protein n=1 Tax=Thiomonas sp. FB-Cd TaxID=1158292 RepID=UPI0004DF69EC|nr:flagellar brake protein [Thiomonas sp. FB-Cd]